MKGDLSGSCKPKYGHDKPRKEIILLSIAVLITRMALIPRSPTKENVDKCIAQIDVVESYCKMDDSFSPALQALPTTIIYDMNGINIWVGNPFPSNNYLILTNSDPM